MKHSHQGLHRLCSWFYLEFFASIRWNLSPPPTPDAFVHTSLFNRDSFFNQIDITWNTLPLTFNLRHTSAISQKQLYEYSFDNFYDHSFDTNASVKLNFLWTLFLWRPELENQRWKIIIIILWNIVITSSAVCRSDPVLPSVASRVLPIKKNFFVLLNYVHVENSFLLATVCGVDNLSYCKTIS